MQEILGGLSLIIIGGGLILFPQKVYELTEKWKSNENTQMSHSYKIIIRVVGTVLIIAGLIVASGRK